jgi:hypothetical protein
MFFIYLCSEFWQVNLEISHHLCKSQICRLLLLSILVAPWDTTALAPLDLLLPFSASITEKFFGDLVSVSVTCITAAAQILYVQALAFTALQDNRLVLSF